MPWNSRYMTPKKIGSPSHGCSITRSSFSVRLSGKLRGDLHGVLQHARHLGFDVLVLFELAAQMLPPCRAWDSAVPW